MTTFTPRPTTNDNFTSSVHYAVTADAHPGALPRVLELFARRGITPDLVKVSKYRSPAFTDDNLAIDIHVSGLSDQEQDIIRQNLAIQVTVQQVRDEVFIGRQKNRQNSPAKLVS
ncbi:acetolactate synthase small subunit [Paremcibacter congregatus]|uniref:ACT domain-containing protein n=1 Tax=Paremcibacter congregatus TaxID=2043170 RepID=A0A2G4YM50_9PROT|nr:acetolactate synthase small subunit [Paremcibacter congregatus]PHZ83393.1 hypothetical protein CRD36_17680 [Paremcibacter congregatus]QDE28137.1 hypothetical protein FIV45_13120 [Paremcibacter congregatus]|tara:strand:+ start:1132 stop:1476 length:345 start_codon:yes stop_codon:yes gene_type:complete